MKIAEIVDFLEGFAPVSLQENYDNAGLITGDLQWGCTGILCCLDVTVNIIDEAISRNANMIVAHHPVIFSGLKKITGRNYVEEIIIKAIKNDLAIYAIHTNLDNVMHGVNGKIADLLDLTNRRILLPKESQLCKLYTFVPKDYEEKVKTALFEAGAGEIGNYSEASFNSEGYGTYKAMEGSQPFIGTIGERHTEREIKMEVIFPAYRQARIVTALKNAHPYEEVAFDIVSLMNMHQEIGSGIIGQLSTPVSVMDFLSLVKSIFHVSFIRHSAAISTGILKVAVCGGAGSFLISRALTAGADIYLTSDMKYHDFFDATDKMMIADIGHYESEQFTTDLLREKLLEKFPTFAVLKTEINTNPVQYF